jgi:hypothetical protein
MAAVMSFYHGTSGGLQRLLLLIDELRKLLIEPMRVCLLCHESDMKIRAALATTG